MKHWEKVIIITTFDRCFGLRDALIKAQEGSDADYKKQAIQSLIRHTGMRQDFIEKHLNEIIKL